MNSDHRALLEYVATLDPMRAQGRLRLQAMLRRCGQLEAHDIAFAPYGRFQRVAS
jgi:hypothetical protein